MMTASYFDAQTGLFTGRTITAPIDVILLNLGQGEGFKEGAVDHLSQKVDIDTNEVVDYQPPPPDAEHEWNESARRWTLKQSIAEARARRATIIATIESKEKQQQRAVREALTGVDGGLDRLKAIQAEIESLRKEL